MTKSAKPGVRRIVVACYPGIEALDVIGPASVFSSATQLLGGRAGYRVELAALRAGAVETTSVTLTATSALGRLRGDLDTLLVPGGLAPALAAGRALVPLLVRLSARARRTASVCTGAFLLAEAGLLDGRRATTHWAACGALARRHPAVTVEPDPIFVRDGHIWTSAGVTAGIDVALALVEEDLGARVALEVARWGVMYLRRPGGQSQFSAPLRAQLDASDEMADLISWISNNLARDLSIEALARRAHMSVRNFARLFRRQTGVTPARFVVERRVEAARQALELGTASVKEIAHACGFANPETLHRTFQRHLSVTPLQYRDRFAV